MGPPPCSIFGVFEPPAAPEGTWWEKGRGPGAPHAPETPPHTRSRAGGRRGIWRAARGLQSLRPCGSRWFLSVSLGLWWAFCCYFFPMGVGGVPGCHAVGFISTWGRGRPAGHCPHSNIFSSHAKKQNKTKCRGGAQRSPAPAWGPGPLTRYFTRSLRQYLSRGLRRATPLLFFFILISHFKMRNKRIFNEPSQQACVCFILVSRDGGSPQGLLVSLPASAPPPQGGEGKGGQEGGTLQCLQSRGRARLQENSSRGPAAGEGASQQVEPLPPAPP